MSRGARCRAALLVVVLTQAGCGAGVRRNPFGDRRGDALASQDLSPGLSPDGGAHGQTDAPGIDAPATDAPPFDSPRVDSDDPAEDATVAGDAGLPLGVPCTAAEQCESRNCTDRRCCDQPCDQACVSCDLTGYWGLCRSVPRGPEPGCTGAQLCDGAGSCRNGPGAPCTIAEGCASGRCAGGRCCREGPPCDPGQTCGGAGECRTPRTSGGPCTLDEECASGFCVDGRCCSIRACPGDCTFCLGPAGTCINSTAGPAPDGACGVRAACDVAGVCKKTSGSGCQTPGECLGGRCEGDTCRCQLCPVTEVVDLGTMRMGQGTGATVRIVNRGVSDQTIGGIRTQASQPGYLDSKGGTCQPGKIVRPGESCELVFGLRADALGSAHGTVDLVTGPGEVLARVSFHVTTVETDALSFDTAVIDFGEVPAGMSSSVVEMSLGNPAAFARDLGPATIEGRDRAAFVIQGGDCAQSLAPMQACNVAVVFKPMVSGGHSATLSLAGARRGLTGVGK
jgi:hypothetical protein